ncbi:hypothetical protein BC936DRAFT_140021 [Jimgerdemannia flammicorona]|uniref:Uncharacterized protein n=1 Tax=Jimgerdemannia flammicorona TaxID=994334 RepID=A0A433B690_9FUNG|nr:hypothetical protein BC936DRAFT_140021 [Jimgerdemannia flammicorona]
MWKASCQHSLSECQVLDAFEMPMRRGRSVVQSIDIGARRVRADLDVPRKEFRVLGAVETLKVPRVYGTSVIGWTGGAFGE